MKKQVEIDKFITRPSDYDYKQIISYINKIGVDYQTTSKADAQSYIEKLYGRLEGGIYIIEFEGTYKIITPGASVIGSHLKAMPIDLG